LNFISRELKTSTLGFEVLAVFYEDSSSVELLDSVGIRMIDCMNVASLDILLQKLSVLKYKEFKSVLS